MKKRKRKKNGIQKTSPAFLWISALIYPRLFLSLLKFLSSVLVKFFFYQFQTVLNPSKRPVVSVDHPLDAGIPFEPSYVGIYNTFTAFWMKSAGWLVREFGWKAMKDAAAFTAEIAMLYNAAGDVYKRSQSTTDRPSVTANPHFVLIHAFDPHLHCVPSLHVMVCSYAAYRTSGLIRKHAEDESLYKQELDWLYWNCQDIIESVLLVKQHSVNCISAGYFMNSALFEGFRNEWAGRFLTDFFERDSKGLQDVCTVREYIIELYNRFIAEYDEEGLAAADIMVRFLERYDGIRTFADTDGVEFG